MCTYLTNFLLGAIVPPRAQRSIALSDSSNPAGLHRSMASQGVARLQKEVRAVALPVLQGITWVQTAI